LTDKLQTHHLYWPRKSYKTKMEKKFRGLPCNLQKLDAQAHKLIHQLNPNGNTGGKPRREVMIQAIRNHENGECKCNQPPLF